MLAKAHQRATDLGRTARLEEQDAHHLTFPNTSFDTVVCTFSLCAIPDPQRALAEMQRVLRPGGRLILADHVAATSAPARVIQRLLEIVTVPLGGEHFLRRPIEHLHDTDLDIEHHQRFKLGIVERVTAIKPHTTTGDSATP